MNKRQKKKEDEKYFPYYKYAKELHKLNITDFKRLRKKQLRKAILSILRKKGDDK